MHLQVFLILLICALCEARSHGVRLQEDESPGDSDPPPPPPPNPQPEAPANPAPESRPVPNHSFEKRVLKSGAGKKVFVKFVQGPFIFKKRREKANRVVFSCNGCEKFSHYLPVFAYRTEVDMDPENDIYSLDIDTLLATTDHVCCTTGIEDLVKQFRKELEEGAANDPTQPFPSLYKSTRSKFTQSLNYDHKLLFLAQIPSYDSVQTSLYRIRRKFVPAAPSTQADLDIDLDWFLVSHDPKESLVKGDVVHSDGLRVLLFATDESLNILARARTIMADGTFRITPHLWYQTFVLSAEFRENSFVPVAFGLLPDKKR